MSDDKDITSVPAENEDENHYTSKLKFREFNLTWIIEDFDFVCKTMKVIESPKFPSTSTEEVKWYFQFEPVELKDGNKEVFRILLKNTAVVETQRKVNLSVTNLYEVGSKFYCHLKSISPNNYTYWSKTGSDFYKQLEWDKTEIKTVKLTCSLSVLDSMNDVISKSISKKNDNLLSQMNHFLDDQSFKDITFKVKDQEFKAHKMILILRSPVFAAIFKNKMTEEHAPVVEIEDIEPDIFEEILHFIYTDNVYDLEESAIELYYAANKYQLENLKRMCINRLHKNLSVDTIIKTFEFAEMFNICDLKRHCLKYLVKNLELLKEKPEYVKLLESYPQLSTKILKIQKTINYETVEYVKYSANTSFQYK